MGAASSRVREFLWWQKKVGLVDDATWNSYMNTLVQDIEIDSDYRRAWERLSATLAPDFVAEIQSRISE